MNFEGLDISILGPAFVAGLLVLATHVPLGQQVLSRGIIFIDLAIAQIAGLGVIAADSLGWEPDGWEVQIAAASAALLGAFLLNWTEKKFREVQEALIGVLFVVAATGGILLLSHNPHGGEHLKELLVGQILWVSYEQLIPVAVLYAIVLVVWWRMQQSRSLIFYVLFALTVTASVQMVGVYLVFSSLIIPALAVRMAKTNKLLLAYIMGAVSYAVGLVISALFDLPTGAVIVWSLGGLGIITAWLIHWKTKTIPVECVK
ncbi:MAG: metal ABC transporter permease [Gammaproteobacteria bacterium]|nr:metal ABC transporter permease [Gammaproteobacteria bacterium]